MARQPVMMVAVGGRGRGKTIETMKTLYQYVQGSAKMKPRKALIFDVNNEFSSYKFPDPTAGMVKHSIKRIAIKDIPTFSESNIIEVRRVAPFWDDGRVMTVDEMAGALALILKYFRNGVLLVEDINLYTTESMKGDLVGRLSTLRHIGVDIIAHYQGISMALTPKILKFTNYIRMHKTEDSVSRHEDKAIEKVHILSIAENIVAKRAQYGMDNGTNDRYFSVMIDVYGSKITGDFTKEDAKFAIMEYVTANPSRLMRPYLNKRDISGKKINTTEEQAYSNIVNDLLGQYFNFK